MVLTRADVQEAERLGMTRSEYERHLRSQAKSPDPDPRTMSNPNRARRRGTTVEISQTEYDALSTIAMLANQFLPTLEASGAPITNRGAYETLRGNLQDVARFGWGSRAADGAAVADLVELLDGFREPSG